MNQIRGYGRSGLTGAATVLALVCSILGAVTILIVSRRYGLGASIDGVVYLTAARQIIDGHGVSNLEAEPLVLFPPLYPLLLAAIGQLTSSVESGARMLHVVLFAGNFLLAAMLLAHYVRHRLVLFGFIGALLVSRTFLLYHYYVLSEPLFILVTLGMLLALTRWLDERRIGWLALGAVLAALSCLTRYVGVANILAGVLVIVWYEREWGRRVTSASMFAIVASLPLLAWLTRNALTGGSLTGDRLPSPYPLLLNLELVADGISRWFVPDEVPHEVRVALVLAAGAGGVFAIMRIGHGGASRSMARVGLLIGFVIAHLVVLVGVTTIFAQDHINTRFLMPIYVPVMILMSVIAAAILTRTRSARPLLFVIFAIWVSIQGFTAVRSIVAREANGVGGYATREWVESDLMEYVNVRRDSLATELYSNAADAVYFRAGLVAKYFPDRLNPKWKGRYPNEALQRRESMGDLKSLLNQPDRAAVLIWFNAATRDPKYEAIYIFNQYSLQDIEEELRLVPIYKASDGGVYRVYAR